MASRLLIGALVYSLLCAPAAAQSTGTLRGVVVDARDGTPLEKVSVRIQGTQLATITTGDGRFELANVPAGRREVYVSAIDFILIRRIVEVPADDVLDITIPVSAGTGTYSETINVSTLPPTIREPPGGAGTPQQRASAAARRHHERSDARYSRAARCGHRR